MPNEAIKPKRGRPPGSKNKPHNVDCDATSGNINGLVAWMTRVKMRSMTLALVLDVSESTVSQWRRGEVRPGLDMAIRISEVTLGGVPVHSWK